MPNSIQAVSRRAHLFTAVNDSPVLMRILLALLAAYILWPSYGEWKLSGVPNLAPPRLLKLLLIGWLAYRFAWCGLPFEQLKARIKNSWMIFFCLLVYEVFQVVAFTLDRNTLYFFYRFIKEEMFTNLLIMFAFLLILRGASDLKKTVEVISLCGLLIGVLVIVESILKQNLYSTIVSDANLSTVFALIDKSRDLHYRAQGPFSHPLLLATFCAGVLPLAWWSLAMTRGLRRFLHFLAVAALVAAAYLSYTRSGLGLVLFALLGCALYEYAGWVRRCRNHLFVMFTLTQMAGLLIVVVIGAGWYGGQLLSGQTVEESMSSYARWEMLRAGIPKIMASPLLGYGPTEAVRGVGFSGRLFGNFLDNYFLLLGLQVGLVGLFAFAGMYIAAFIRSRRLGRLSGYSGLGFFLALSLACFFVMQIVHALTDLMWLLYVIIALTVVASAGSPASEPKSSHTVTA